MSLTPRRMVILSSIPEDTLVDRKFIVSFMIPDVDPRFLSLSSADRKAIDYLSALGCIESRKEPGRPNPASERWLYQRTPKGSRLLEVFSGSFSMTDRRIRLLQAIPESKSVTRQGISSVLFPGEPYALSSSDIVSLDLLAGDALITASRSRVYSYTRTPKGSELLKLIRG